MDRLNIRRVYTGFNGNSDGKLPGTEAFIQFIARRTQRILWNNGSWGVRRKRSKNEPSVHGTGRAVDISWRHTNDGRGAINGKQYARKWMNDLADNATDLGIELIIDYSGGVTQPFGRAWRCDRMRWQRYLKPTVQSGGKGDWFHVELSPHMATDETRVRLALVRTFGPLGWISG